MIEASRLGLDVVLDPKTHAAAFVGGYSDNLGELPWGLGRQSTLLDYVGDQGRARAAEIAGFATQRSFSAVLAPTHIVAGARDPWFRADVDVAGHMRRDLPSEIAVFYPLVVSMQSLREPAARREIIDGLQRVQMDALWLRIENFGSDASGEKVRAYIEALSDFHALGVPLISDCVGGIPALSALAFGATGGIAHGVMMLEAFRASGWRRPPSGNPRAPSPRVYIQSLDMLVSREQAEALFGHSTRVRGQHACRDPRCCPKGHRDMMDHPARHYLNQRAREFESLSSTPSSLRVNHLMEHTVRPRSDALAAVASLGITHNRLAATLQDRHRSMGRFRGALSNLAETFEPNSTAQAPLSRSQREDR